MVVRSRSIIWLVVLGDPKLSSFWARSMFLFDMLANRKRSSCVYPHTLHETPTRE